MRGVEAAEYESVVGQAEIGAAAAVARNPALAVVGLIAGQAQHFLGIENLLAARDDRLVGDQIVMIGRAHRRGIAEPVDLHWRGPEREDARACEFGVAVEIDENVDAVARDRERRLEVADV